MTDPTGPRVDRRRLFCDLVGEFSGRSPDKCHALTRIETNHLPRDGRVIRYYGQGAVDSALTVVGVIDQRRIDHGDRDPKMMAHFIAESEREKVQMTARFNDPEWMAMASEVSKRWAEEASQKTFCQLAQEHYDYSRMRAAARQGRYVIDPTARELWLKVAGHLPDEVVIKDPYGRD